MMEVQQAAELEILPVTRLTHDELDRQIRSIGAELQGPRAERSRAAWFDGSASRPRWISAAELVRRMRPFLVYN